MTPSDLIEEINYHLLKQQKLTLLEVLDALEAAPPENDAARKAAEHIEGLVGLIDAIQDVAESEGVMPEDAWLSEDLEDSEAS